MTRKEIPMTVMLDSRDAKRLREWGEKLGISPEGMIRHLIGDERKRRGHRQ